MMETARQRAGEMNISNIAFVQGDVGSLPFADESFDTVVSLNGFHAFPDKEAAFRETYRVLKKGGMFTGCFYIEGIEKRSDLILQTLYTKTGFFTPPFETKEGLKRRLENMYSSVQVSNLHSIGIFRCTK
jgi:ubiquinone/menaquinone biosynthesis C-methylase UbiE